MGERCSGHCCKAMYLPFTPQELQDEAAKGNDSKYMEIEQIAGMVRYLGNFKRSEMGLFQGSPLGEKRDDFYTCTNLQPNGDCGIYADRPSMCRDYPYGRRCNFDECTWDEARAAPHVDASQLVQIGMA